MDAYKLVDSVARRDMPEEVLPLVDDASGLLDLLAKFSTGQGYYWANPRMIWRKLLVWQVDSTPLERVVEWLDQLEMDGAIVVGPFGRSSYGGGTVDLLRVRNLHRWNKTARPYISPKLRGSVYERDGHHCVECGATEHLSLDHIVPFSKGGPDTYENLRTLCRSCNSKKGARV